MNEYKTVRLYGRLGALFGRVHRLVIDSPAEAIRALCATVPGFEMYLQTANQRGMRFTVFKGRENVSRDELAHGCGGSEIRIAPVLAGSKRGGMFQMILGAVLIVASIWMPGLSIAASNLMFSAGAAMSIGGVVQMLAPQMPGLASRQDADNKPSYAFGGPVNTTAMGNPVPVGYGLRERGGAIVSAGIYTDDYR
ncbi:TPA: tail assembly protein [Klebsiella aerogenes]|nr:tail assembly protein [Klebsiella aerogenes]